jgi:hypothetical protein
VLAPADDVTERDERREAVAAALALLNPRTVYAQRRRSASE